MLAVSLALVLPIVALVGSSGAGARTIALVVGTTLVSWELVRIFGRPRTTARARAAMPARPVAHAIACRSNPRRSTFAPQPFPRMRGGTPARAPRPQMRRPEPARPARDVRCAATTRRASRRRTRP